MSDVTPETRAQVIREVCAARGVSEDTLNREWDSWASRAQENVTAGASASDVKNWFVRHLQGMGVLSSSKATQAGTQKSKAEAEERVGDAIHPLMMLDDDDGDEISDEDDAQAATVEDDLPLEDETEHDSWFASLVGEGLEHPSVHEHQDELDQELQAIVESHIEEARKEGTLSATPPKSGAGLEGAQAPVISDEMFERAERRVMAALMSEARADADASSSGGLGEEGLHLAEAGFESDDDADDHGEEELEPIGQRRLGRGRGKERVGRYALAKALGNWALRHRDSDAEKVTDAGLQMGNGLALKVVDLDRKQRRKKKFPITAGGIRARQEAVVHILIEAIDAAGSTSTPARDYAEANMRKLEADLRQYATAIASVGASLKSGSLWDRMKSLRKGAGLKWRAVMNEAQMRIMISTILSLANNAVPRPGERAVPGFGRDADVKRRIRTFGKKLQHVLTSHDPSDRTGRKRAASNDGASFAAINLAFGAAFAFVTHPEMYDQAADYLLGATLTKLGQEQGEIPKQAVDLPTSIEDDRGSPKVPGIAQKLATDLTARAGSYLRDNPSVRKKNGARYVLLVPADKLSLAKVRSQLAGSEDAAERYIRGALLARHPDRALDRKGHLISLSGTAFHIDLPSLEHNRSVIQQMRPKASGGSLERHPNRLPMDCVQGDMRTIQSSKAARSISTNIRIHPVFYWPRAS